VVLVSADGATREGLAYLRKQRDTGVELNFSVGFTMPRPSRAANLNLPKRPWTEAINADGGLREGAHVAELTGMLGDLTAAGRPTGMRVIERRERTHPAAQLRFTDEDGWRFQTFATDTAVGQFAQPEAWHRAHTRVEDGIRCARTTPGPAKVTALETSAAWVELALTTADLIAWNQTTARAY
jgi:hypothetical protein